MNPNDGWQRVYSDLYPDNTAMRVECNPRYGLTRLIVINSQGIEVVYVFGQQQAFQAAFALMKSLDLMAHADIYKTVPPAEVRQ